MCECTVGVDVVGVEVDDDVRFAQIASQFIPVRFGPRGFYALRSSHIVGSHPI